MNEPTKTNFQPRWYRNASPELREAIADFPASGSKPFDWPRIVIRVLPASGYNSLAAHTVSEVIDLTQKLAHFAAYDEVRGVNPDFADLRSMGAEVLAFSKLTIEPFAEGSFVIPARLESSDFVKPDSSESDDSQTAISAESVAGRFGAILDEIATGEATTSISTGALQTVQQLNRTLKREANAIEYSTFDRRERQISFRTVDSAFIGRVESVIKNRQASVEKLDSLEGVVTAVDMEKGELLLTLPEQKERVKGTFPVMLHPTLLESLGQNVTLFGKVSFRSNRPHSVAIQQAKIIDVD